ncbi:hypothetical protein B6264_26930 [Kitasatospora aureofaciens]|nr:hypothetical protein B6264_26930 [Kitasatospora aureofaciens]
MERPAQVCRGEGKAFGAAVDRPPWTWRPMVCTPARDPLLPGPATTVPHPPSTRPGEAGPTAPPSPSIPPTAPHGPPASPRSPPRPRRLLEARVLPVG